MVKYNREHRDEINARNRFNYANNIGGVKDKMTAYRRANANRYKALHAVYYRKNKKRLIADMVEYNREWRKKNHDLYLAQARVYDARRRAKLKAAD